MNNIYEIKCFIASPGDTTEERDACESVFEEINHGLGKSLGFHLCTLRWERDVYPSVAKYGQQVISQQVEGKYDLFIGIMKNRFGTPTPNAGSGTEEEFNIAYEKFQDGEVDNIFFFFFAQNMSPYDFDIEQFQKVIAFRKKMQDNGVVPMEYKNLDDFKKQLKNNLESYFNTNKPSKRKIRKQKDKKERIIKSKVSFFEYRNLWEDILNSKDLSKKKIEDIKKKRKLCRFPKIIFPQESFVQRLMNKEPLTEEKAFLFALAVKREKTLQGSIDTLSEVGEDWAIYEQIQRNLFNLDFAKSKELVCNWDAKDYWLQNKAMRMAVYDDQKNEAETLLAEAIKKERNPSEQLHEVILANFISLHWLHPYSRDEFWRYGLDGQGDMLNYMMSSLCKKSYKPKRRGWIGSTWNFGSNHGEYVKSLRILQFIIDSGIYVYLPGVVMFEISNWYIVFKNLYEYFPYPCFFYSIQYSDREVQRRIGEDFAYNINLQNFNADILVKSIDAIGIDETPVSFKNGILNVIAAMYIVVDETLWFEKFKDSVFRVFLQRLHGLNDSDELTFNVKFALGSIKNPDNIYWTFQQLISRYSTNEEVISGIIVNNMMIQYIHGKAQISNTLMFPNVLNQTTLDLLDRLNKASLLSDECIASICDIVHNTNIQDFPRDRAALFQLFNLTKHDKQSIEKIKRSFLSMNIWHCGVLNDKEFGWTEPMYIRLNLLNDKITWTDEEFEIIKENLIKNVSTYDEAHESLHEDPFMKSIQVRYLSDMIKFIDGLKADRQEILLSTKKVIEKLLLDRTQYTDNIDLMMSEQSADVDRAMGNIYEGIMHNGIEKYRNDIDFMIDRAIMKSPIGLTRNIRCIKLICEQIISFGYAKKLHKLLAVYKDSESWSLFYFLFSFNYLHSIAKVLKQNEEADEVINFWIENTFVNRFIVV